MGRRATPIHSPPAVIDRKRQTQARAKTGVDHRSCLFSSFRGGTGRVESHETSSARSSATALRQAHADYRTEQGTSVLLITLVVFVTARSLGEPESNIRAITFITLVLSNLTLILANRSWTRPILSTLRSPNPALWWVIGGALGVLALAIYLPFARDLFRFSKLHNIDLLICSVAGFLSVMWFEALKIVAAKRATRDL